MRLGPRDACMRSGPLPARRGPVQPGRWGAARTWRQAGADPCAVHCSRSSCPLPTACIQPLPQALHKDVGGSTVDLAAAVSRMAMDGPEPLAANGGGEATNGDGSDDEQGGGSGMEEDEGEGAAAGSGGGKKGKRRRGRASEGFKEQARGAGAAQGLLRCARVLPLLHGAHA